ncbi:DUF3108 domain-containing protein [Undibacterium sp.]|jgi:hypothetical protein|uniref:DUF3108 domain-containing protein n=1 Tax=Undibacterium sp. TaxID=1914977 RepID=UPI002D089BC5|nr:DUF3108 domain-containing protein [Undibacterium sp.]HTD06077.1 DUF3108 domain-containing protein [Undibacterium sp.]
MPTTRNRLRTKLLIAASAFLALAAHADNGKYAYNLPPSADLQYTIKAKQSGLPLSGDATVKWHLSGAADTQKYSVITETRAMLVGKILDASSIGGIDNYGLAPEKFVEKRFRRAESTTSFDRAGKQISFSESAQKYPIKGGEQDRTSATWQLIALARAAGDKFKAGTEWKFLVAGRRDADPWSFKVAGQENLRTAIGDLATVHVVKAPPPDSQDQQLDLWLAPSLEWYPVRVRFEDANGDYVDQLISNIKK